MKRLLLLGITCAIALPVLGQGQPSYKLRRVTDHYLQTDSTMVRMIDLRDSLFVNMAIDSLVYSGLKALAGRTDEYCLTWEDTGDRPQWETCPGAGGGDNVSVDGVASADPNFTSAGDLDAIRCTGAGAPDASCGAAEDVIYRYNATSVNLTADVTGILPGANGGTNNGFMDFTGPTTSLKTFTLPDATSTILTSNADVTVAQGGTGVSTLGDGALLVGAATGNVEEVAAVATGSVLVSAGTSTNPVWDSTPDLGTPSAVNLTNATANSLPSSAINTEVRSMYWNAGGMSADATDCTDPTEGALVTSGPKTWSITCPMTTSETDGYIYGSVVLPDSYSNATTPTFEITLELATDAGAATIHGAIGVQCFTAQETGDASWTEVQLDVTEDVADVVDDYIQGASSASLTGESCAGGDVMYWRYTVCDTDATPSSNCTSNAGVENDFNVFGMKMEYVSTIGD